MRRAWASGLAWALLAAPAAAAPNDLQNAAAAGDLPRVEALLKAGAQLDAQDARGYTALIWAAQQGKLALVQALLGRHAKMELADANGYTALIWAAQQGHVEVVVALLAAGARPDAREKHGFDALAWAAYQGHVPCVKALLAAGSDPTKKGPTGYSADDLARRAGRSDVVALFAPPPVPIQLAPPPTTQWALLGHSAQGRPIPVASLGDGPRTLLLIGTIHGDEPQGEDVIARLLKDLEANPGLLDGARLVAVPVVNPDGKARRTRGNARGVDLNRNFPMRWAPSATGRTYGGPFPLSEPESRLLLALIDREKPNLIVSFHADMRCNNYDGAAAAPIAREMSRRNGYKVLPEIGYPTPGSLGQQAAYAMGIPIVTLEVGHEAPAPLYAKVRDSLVLGLRAKVGPP
jgi:hypothetical protein